jgi:Raf kinase inhibitor-like YbhB/YbcL family protein
MAFVINSPALKAGQSIPVRYTCDGENLSPPLTWAHPPAHTKAFALVMEDPDAPGGTFTHWMLCDLRATRADLDEGGEADGDGTPGTNDFSKLGYGGPCPPRGHGRHRYRFRLLALSKPLGLRPGFSRAQLDKALAHVVLGTAILVTSYER